MDPVKDQVLIWSPRALWLDEGYWRGASATPREEAANIEEELPGSSSPEESRLRANDSDPRLVARLL